MANVNDVAPEAELESRIAAALKFAFPNIPPDKLKQQRTFTVRVGHHTHDFDSGAEWRKSGRADILLFYDDRPLAVLEVKRENLQLTTDDYQQGQSYANQLTPRPPLVVVTNGHETKVYDGNTGTEWAGLDDAQAQVQSLLANSAKIASQDMRWAIEALMGRETGVWVPVVRGCTTKLVSDLTDPVGQSRRPFAKELLFPRQATQQVLDVLRGNTLFTVISGSPAAGKSSVLRELTLRTETSDDVAVLMLRGSGPGLFQAVANLFAAELDWTLSANDARQWLRRLSTGTPGPALVIAIDNVEPKSSMAADLEELVTLNIGQRLKVVLTTDDPDGLTRTANARSETGLGAHAVEIAVGSLGLVEFREAQRVLADARIFFTDGAEYAEDYRAPWALRTIYDSVVQSASYADPTKGPLLPPALGIKLVEAARRQHAGQADLLRGYRLLARDMIADDLAGPAELALLASNSFVVRRDALSSETREHLDQLKSGGWIRLRRHADVDVVFPTVPTAFLAELAEAVSAQLDQRVIGNPREAGTWLGDRLDHVYLGDVVGAEAIRLHANRTGGFSSGIVEGLLADEPIEEVLENASIAMTAPDGSTIYIKIEDGQARRTDSHGTAIDEPVDLGAERSRTYGRTTSWMILGQLARLPTALAQDQEMRMDASILLAIGKCPFPLMRANEEGLPHLEHDLGPLGHVLCTDQGPIEPMTLAMAELLSKPWDLADAFVDEIVGSESLPLIHRLLIALQTVQQRDIPVLSDWADRSLRDKVSPMIKRALDGLAAHMGATDDSR